MDSADKLTTVQALSEAQLRREVLIPLLARMDYRTPTEYHGPREHGKDIVCSWPDSLGEQCYLAVVAKTSDLSGSVSDNRGMMEVLNQVQQCFDEPYYDLFGMRIVTMNAVWVVTSGHVVPGAQDSVTGRLEKSNLSKNVRFISGARLIELIDKHFPTYWSRSAETAEQVRGERDRYYNFVRDLLRSLGATPEKCEEVLTTLSHSGRPPFIRVNDWDLTWISSRTLSLERMADRYPIGTTSFDCGNMREAFRLARDSVQYALRTIEETFYDAEKVFRCTDPHEFLKAFNKELRKDYPFWRPHGYQIPDEVSRLECGVNEVDRYFARIDAAGLHNEVVRYMAAIDALTIAVEEYIRGVDVDEFELGWELTNGTVIMHPDGNIGEGKDGFVTNHVRKETRNQRGQVTEISITATMIIEAAQLGLREHIEPRLPREDDPY